MIRIGDNRWITHAQPIFVNDRRVNQVWANNRMVYPDGAEIVKAKFYINDTFSHTDNWSMASAGSAPPGVFGPCVSPFSIKASGAGVFRIYGTEVKKGILKRGVNDYNMPYGSTLYDHNWYGPYHVPYCERPGLLYPLGTTLVCPEYGMPDLDTFKVSGLIQRLKIRYNMSMIPVCGPFRTPAIGTHRTPNLYTSPSSQHGNSHYYNAVGNDNMYVTYDLIPTGYQISGPSEFNNTVFSYYSPSVGELAFNRAIASSYMQNSYTRLVVNYDTNESVNPYYYYNGIYILCIYRVPVQVLKTSVNVANDASADMGTQYTEESFCITIPISEILYAGNELDAPAWAKTITEEDLMLD